MSRIKGDVQWRDARYAVVAAYVYFSELISRAGSAIDETEKDERNCEGDDRKVDIAYTAKKRKVANERRQNHGRNDGRQYRPCAVTHIDGQHGIDVRPYAKKGRLTQSQYASKAPHQPQA